MGIKIAISMKAMLNALKRFEKVAKKNCQITFWQDKREHKSRRTLL